MRNISKCKQLLKAISELYRDWDKFCTLLAPAFRPGKIKTQFDEGFSPIIRFAKFISFAV